jgi:hypothetical protein
VQDAACSGAFAHLHLYLPITTERPQEHLEGVPERLNLWPAEFFDFPFQRIVVVRSVVFVRGRIQDGQYRFLDTKITADR